ncbi:MAG: helix-turn-helix transcriptional regulator [Alicyclobacillus sp.]|nr:helix-turn-helix transcriptional regulator [Alicyclobacillus sp.]
MGREPAAVAGALAELVEGAQLQVFGRGERAVYALPGATAGLSVPAVAAAAEPLIQGSPLRGAEGWRLAERLYTPAQEAERTGVDSAGWPLAGLTDREREVLALTVTGLSNRAIAQALHISEHTVKNHLSHVFQKLGVSNRRELLAQWLR